jgi:hypothetical protein
MFKEIVKFIILAQTASDAGKGYDSTTAVNGKKAIDSGYRLKDKYIRQAIGLVIKANKKGDRNIVVSLDHDYGMSVVLFDVKGYGQISFHSYSNYKKFEYMDAGRPWNGIIGGSVRTCQKLARRFNLPWYNHG